VPALIKLAREKGFAVYVGEGKNRWPAVHRLDTAKLYRLALEKGTSGAKFHGVADEGIPIRDIAEVIGRRLNVHAVSKTPEEAAALGWHPAQPGLLRDLEHGRYFENGSSS